MSRPSGRSPTWRGRPATAIVATAVALSACTSELGGGEEEEEEEEEEAAAAAGTIKIGYVTPQTGALAPFGEADSFVIKQMSQYFKDNPLKIGDQSYGVEILVKDSQSDAKRAGEVASELINSNGADLILVASTPDTTNPVADQCEANGVPCISSVAPWQPFFFGRGGSETKSFTWTYHFVWGLEDVEAVYLDMWSQVGTNSKAGALWPNDPDGTAWGDKATGFGPVVAKQGYSIVDPGFSQASNTADAKVAEAVKACEALRPNVSPSS